MPRRSRRIATTQSSGRTRRERRPNVYTGDVPQEPPVDDANDPVPASPEESGSTPPAAAVRPSRRAARQRRAGPARSRAAVYIQYLPAELKKMGITVLGAVIILSVLTVLLR